jgi:hypothetical protein
MFLTNAEGNYWGSKGGIAVGKLLAVLTGLQQLDLSWTPTD